MALLTLVNAEVYFAIRHRAIAFATFPAFGGGWFSPPNADWHLLKASPAGHADVDRCGTSGSAIYAEMVLGMEHTASFVAARMAEATPPEDSATLVSFYGSPFDLRVVCSAVNVIHHEWVDMDICDREIAPFQLRPGLPADANRECEPFASICRRALKFARRDPRFCAFTVLQVSPAPGSVVEQVGTPGSADYGEVIVGRQYSAAHCDSMLAWEEKLPNPNLERIQDFLAHPLALRVVCTANDVIQHEDVPLIEAEARP